jgi:hypothetical protein
MKIIERKTEVPAARLRACKSRPAARKSARADRTLSAVPLPLDATAPGAPTVGVVSPGWQVPGPSPRPSYRVRCSWFNGPIPVPCAPSLVAFHSCPLVSIGGWPSPASQFVCPPAVNPRSCSHLIALNRPGGQKKIFRPASAIACLGSSARLSFSHDPTHFHGKEARQEIKSCQI